MSSDNVQTITVTNVLLAPVVVAGAGVAAGTILSCIVGLTVLGGYSFVKTVEFWYTATNTLVTSINKVNGSNQCETK